MDILIATLLKLLNETLASTIVVISTSFLLWNLSRNLNDRVARTSALVLGCVTWGYVCDVFVSLGPGVGTYTSVLRLQWIAIAFMPTAMLHLSDALLATTGLPSRGRRRKTIRLLYLVSVIFIILAAFTDLLIKPVPLQVAYFPDEEFVSTEAGELFPVYIFFFVSIVTFAFINLQRAKDRCLARSTRRRMGYLQYAILLPSLGIFPFSILLGSGAEYSITGLILVNIANIGVVLMLLFLAYPLSFFGSRTADRVIKRDLLQFMLRGPATSLLALVTIFFTIPATRIFGLPGLDFMPFAVVTVILVWQWFIHLALPYLERRLIYTSQEDYEQIEKLSTLAERLSTPSDLQQLLEAVLSSTCDYLRVNTVFVVAFQPQTEIVAVIGSTRPSLESLTHEEAHLIELLSQDDDLLKKWQSFWVAPLYSQRTADDETLITGMFALQARANEIDLNADEIYMLRKFITQAAQAIDDRNLQSEIYASLEGLLPQMQLTRNITNVIEYRPGYAVKNANPQEILADPEQFREQVRAALRHYWGGPGLSSSRLLTLQSVQTLLEENDQSAPKALRSLLQKGVDALRPEGDRKLLAPEWTLYNIVEMRFIKGQKVKEVAQKLSVSEADFYRKQNVAIQAVAENILKIEHEASETKQSSNTPQ